MCVLQGLVENCNDFEIVFKQLQYSSSPTICFVLPSIDRIKNICTIQDSEEAPITALKRNILSNLEKWDLNLSIWHKSAVFFYPPAITLQQVYTSDIKDFCTEKIIENSNEISFDVPEICPLTAVPPPDSEDCQTAATSGSFLIHFTSGAASISPLIQQS